jgi:hypothetical protein
LRIQDQHQHGFDQSHWLKLRRNFDNTEL